METIICDRSAFLYWRTPPIAHLLASGREDDSLLGNLLSAADLARLRANLRAASPLFDRAYGPGGSRAHYGPAGQRLGGSTALLSTEFGGPVDVLSTLPRDRRPSAIIRPRVWSEALPAGAVCHVDEGVAVFSPVLAVQQLAVRTNPVRVALLLSELMGTFSVYQPPEPLAAALQGLADADRLPAYCGWRAARDNDGRLTGLWSRPPLLEAAALRAHLSHAPSRGRSCLAKASLLARVGAASPFEVQAGMLLAEVPAHGGEGYGELMHNRRVQLSADARQVCRQGACYCDLFWECGERGVDVECQSASHHFGVKSSARDADRATALQMMGIEVIQLTYAQMADASRFEVFSRFLAEKIGAEYREKSEREGRAQRELRAKVLVSWESLPNV